MKITTDEKDVLGMLSLLYHLRCHMNYLYDICYSILIPIGEKLVMENLREEQGVQGAVPSISKFLQDFTS